MASAAKRSRRSSSNPKSPCSSCSNDDPTWNGPQTSSERKSQRRHRTRAETMFHFHYEDFEEDKSNFQSEQAKNPPKTAPSPETAKMSGKAKNQGKNQGKAEPKDKAKSRAQGKAQPKASGKPSTRATGKPKVKAPMMDKTEGKAQASHQGKVPTEAEQPVGPVTLSRSWLQDGSSHYRSVTDNLTFMLKRQRLNMALNSYYKALNIAEILEDKASASKNMGLASWKMATMLKDEGAEDIQVNFYYKEAMKYLSQAKDLSNSMSLMWVVKLGTLGSRCWTEIMERYGDLDLEVRTMTLRPFLPLIVSDLMKAEAYLEQAENFFKCGITALQNKNFKECLSKMRDCYFPMNEAKRVGSEYEHVLSEVTILEKDTFLHTCIAESMQAKETGDRLFAQLVEEEEHLNMTLVYDIIDIYKKSILLTRDQDLEMEAIGHSRLGRVYHRILKRKIKAKENFRYSMDLARAMDPRNFYSEEWYKTAADAISQYQQETDFDEEARRQKEKDEVLKEIKKEVTELKNTFNKKDRWEFLQYVYKTFPPKNPLHVLGEITTKEPDMKMLKKLYQKAVIHYHPDKADEEKNGKQWKVLSEEICKYLTHHYEHFKL